jgi:phage-related protein
MKGFMPVIEKLDTFIKGGASAVTRFNNLQKIVGRNESNDYASSLRSLLENEMETSEILLASQDIVDQITDMYEKVAEIKSSAVLELVDRMSDEMGQEQAESYQNQIGPALEALEQALATARQGAQDSVAIVKGEAPQPMAGDGDIDTGMDLDTGDKMSGDADIEGGDDFGASEPAAGGDEPVGRAER